MRKRIVAGLATSLVLVGAPAFTATTYAHTNSPVYIHLWTPWTGTDTQPIDGMVRRFNETHSDIKVQVHSRHFFNRAEINHRKR